MKKSGIIHAELMKNIAALGHFDSFVICDMGFPIPKGATIIDLALVRGIPRFWETLEAILSEVVVQSAVMIKGVETVNAQLHEKVKNRLVRQSISYVDDLSEFRELTKDARFFVRTGEDMPLSNMMFISASGALSRVEMYDV